MTINPFNFQLLAFVFIWSHQIHKELAPDGEPLLPELHTCLSYAEEGNWSQFGRRRREEK